MPDGTSLQGALQDISAIGFVVIAVLAVREWRTHGGRPRGYQASAIGLLAATAVLSLIPTAAGSDLVADLTVGVFMAAGFMLLLFRGTFMPIARWWTVTMAALCILSLGLVIVLGMPVAGAPDQGPKVAAVLLLIAVWVLCVIEPTVRFWMAARGRPRVQASRLRALTLGYLGIIAVLVADGSIRSTDPSETVHVGIQLLGIATIPLLWAAFTPPLWLRRLWRAREEERMRESFEDLVLFSSSRAELGGRALEWAERLVGGDAAVLFDGNGLIVARLHIEALAAVELLAAIESRWPSSESDEAILNLGNNTLAIGMSIVVDGFETKLVVLSGPFTPLFGTDEVGRLRSYLAAVSLGLRRVSITERLADVERIKGEFLNLASHELRGPLTVLRGYMSMLADGDLGDLPEAACSALVPMLRQGEQMSKLIDQMIETARLEDNRLELHWKQFDVGALTREVVAHFKDQAPEAELIELDEPGLPITIEADRDRIRTVIDNLLVNAVKYSPSGGEVASKRLAAAPW